MLRLVNRYAHGYVLGPVVVSLRRNGVIDLLATESSWNIGQLADRTFANLGHLRVALRSLESFGWCHLSSDGTIQALKEMRGSAHFPETLLELLAYSIDARWFENVPTDLLASLIESSRYRWGVRDERLADTVDGILIIPTLLALQDLGASFGKAMSGLGASARGAVESLFEEKGWALGYPGRLELTNLGCDVWNCVRSAQMVASYRPMLACVDALLFGDATSVFARDKQGHETHIDRRANVGSSGSQHQKFFTDLVKVVADVFDQLPLEQQPKYICDLGCGDGTLLKLLFEAISEDCVRGKVLDQYPLLLIGTDINEESLAAAAHTLAGLPHRLLAGDIGDPEGLLKNLRLAGIDDPDNILHVRSFMDHERSFQEPLETTALHRRENFPFSGVYARRDGSEISMIRVWQNLVDHLKRWATVTNSFGIIALELHCLPPRITSAFFDECENLHYDAFHGFSGQLLVEAEQYLMAAAEVGLFAAPRSQQRYPQLLPFTRITLNHFEKRPYVVRYAADSDLDDLHSLEAVCWPQPLQTPVSTLARRLNQNPAGQFVLEMEGRVVGALYTQRIANADSLKTLTHDQVDVLFDPEGSVGQLIALNISPHVECHGIGDQLLEFVLGLLSVTSGIEHVVGVTRCRDFPSGDIVAMDECLQQNKTRPKPEDAILRFHASHGAKIDSVVPNYRPLDAQNSGCGILIEYDIHRRKPKARLAAPADQDTHKHANNSTDYILTSIRSVLGPHRQDVYASDLPWVQQGLDSLDLVELGSLLCRHFRCDIEADFFLRYPTPSAVLDFFQSREGNYLSHGR